MTAYLARPSIIAAAIAVLLAIAGCGGSGSKHSTHAASTRPDVGAATGASPSGASTSRTATVRVDGGKRKDASITVRVANPGAAGAAQVTFAAPGAESRSTFIAKADAICRSFRTQARKIGAGATTFAAQETELPRLVKATEEGVRALTELSPPTVEAAGLQRFATMTVGSVVAFAQAQTRTSSTSEAAGSQVEAKDLADSAHSSSDATAAAAAAHELGLHVCGSPGSAWL